MRSWGLRLSVAAALFAGSAPAWPADTPPTHQDRGATAFATAALVAAPSRHPSKTWSNAWTTAVVPSADASRFHLAGPLAPTPASPAVEPAPDTPATAPEPDKPAPWRAVWAGGDWMENAWTAYTGFAAAPFGSLATDGLRVRSVAGYGHYRYDARRLVGKTLTTTRHRATKTFADLLVGYQASLGALTLKGFVGVAGRADVSTPYDATNPTEGMHYGARLEADAWYEVSPMVWAAASLAWTNLQNTYGARLRVGARLTPEISLGLETAATKSDAGDTGRLGAFVRYAWDTGEVSLAGGIAGNLDGSLADHAKGHRHDDSPYVSLNWLTKF